MGKKDSFAVGSLVFARVKGYAPWPARITKAEKKKYSVYFYGTGEISQSLKPEDLFDYVVNKAKFVVDKNLKRKHYKEAVDQIENALKGNEDISAINEASPPPDLSTNNITTEMETTVEEASTLMEPDAEPDSEIQIPSLMPESKINSAVTSTPLPAPEKKHNESSVVSEPPPTIPEEPEIVSRSGRKIKPKRFLDSETDEIIMTPKRKATTDSMKEELPTGADKNVTHYLKLESTLIELDHMIKSSVGLNGAKPDECIKYLNEYKMLEITPLMLKKHPNCVETMKRLRRYVGNLKAWAKDDKFQQDFETKAQQIRTNAEEIYNSFKKMFNFHSDTQAFWDYFLTVVNEFKEKTSHLTVDEILELIEEPKDDENNES